MNQYDSLSTRAGFNSAVRHLQTTIFVDEQIVNKKNVADILNKEIDDKEIENFQAIPILNALLVTKHGYQYKSFNIEKLLSEYDGIVGEVSNWNALDMVITYHHPTLGFSIINPKNKSHWDKIRDIMRDELIVIYCRYLGREKDAKQGTKIANQAIESLIKLLNGSKVSGLKEFTEESLPKPEPKPEEVITPVDAITSSEPQATEGVSVTPKYSVQVSNELFHNGNVEAWKNIIESFVVSHPGLNVTVYHEGELIQDLNTLFKWGKVKHGGCIFFQVSGENIKDVSKLKRYLYEGASHRYENFLKKDISKPIRLF
jgi:hypothetical protein